MSPTLSSDRQPHVLISGWYGHANSGDEAILSTFVDQMGGAGGFAIYVLTTEPAAIDRDYSNRGASGLRHWEYLGLRGLENFLRGRIFRPIRLLRNSEMLVFGGGSILRDNSTWRNLFRLLDDIFLARMFGVPVVFYALGVGPFRSWAGRKLIAWASHCATAITVRDETSAALLASLGIAPERIMIVSDPALLLADTDPAQAVLAAGLGGFLAAHPKTLFVYPTESLQLPAPAETEDHLVAGIAEALHTLAEQDGYAIVFVPLRVTGSADDVAMSRRIASLLPSSIARQIVEHGLSPTQIRALTQTASINVTVRLHAMIYAVSSGVPVVSLNYEPKVRANATRFGLGAYLIDPDAAIAERLVTTVRSLRANMESERAALATRLPGLRRQAEAIFTAMKAVVGTQP